MVDYPVWIELLPQKWFWQLREQYEKPHGKGKR